MLKMRNKKEIKIGNIIIGGNRKIAIQSMCNTITSDVTSTVEQILKLEKAGCEIARVAVRNMADAKSLGEIKKLIHIPLVADIHFDYKLALEAINQGIDKIRINPGNIGSIEKIKMVVDGCKAHSIPIRIGVNMGSLDPEIEKEYGRCAKSLVESAKKHIEILESLQFYDIVLSLKASNIKICVEAYEMIDKMYDYPLHIGITEAGSKYSGTVKSAIGMGILINENIGDTIRVSLSTDPVEEIKCAKEILSNFGLYTKPIITSCPTCGRCQYEMFPIVDTIEEWLSNTYPNVKIHVAIMGCAVNGPGEAKDADIGIAGGKNEALIFIHGVPIRKVKQDDIIKELEKEIANYINKNK